MYKMQVLFPEPQIRTLKDLSAMKDQPVSELIRKAVDFWLECQGTIAPQEKKTPPRHTSGGVLVKAGNLREAAYE